MQLLMKMRPSVTIITPLGDGTYWCDVASVFDPAKKGRNIQVMNKSSGEHHTGILNNAYCVRYIADNDVLLGLDLVNYYTFGDPVISTKITLSPQTLVEVKFANWSSSRKFTKDEIAEAVRVFSQYPEEAGWTVSSTGTSGYTGSWWSPALSSALSSGVGVKTVEGGMVPPSVKVPPAEPKPKKKWWKR